MPNPSDFFQCCMCGDCCKGYGGTVLEHKDVETISRYLRMAASDFLRDCCEWSGKKPVIKTAPSGYCIFWDKVCTIHEVKPRMCRLWPFIDGVLRDPSNWSAMQSVCPGIRTDVPTEALLQCVKAILDGDLRAETEG